MIYAKATTRVYDFFNECWKIIEEYKHKEDYPTLYEEYSTFCKSFNDDEDYVGFDIEAEFSIDSENEVKLLEATAGKGYKKDSKDSVLMCEILNFLDDSPSYILRSVFSLLDYGEYLDLEKGE